MSCRHSCATLHCTLLQVVFNVFQLSVFFRVIFSCWLVVSFWSRTFESKFNSNALKKLLLLLVINILFQVCLHDSFYLVLFLWHTSRFDFNVVRDIINRGLTIFRIVTTLSHKTLVRTFQLKYQQQLRASEIHFFFVFRFLGLLFTFQLYL